MPIYHMKINPEEQLELAKRALVFGESASQRDVVALARAKLQYTRDALEICSRFHCKAFASIVPRGSPKPNPAILRKDYAYLFERFFYFLEDTDPNSLGIIVFDELEKSRSHILLDQMDNYFRKTMKGKQRANRIIPEPFFVHSDLTTGIQLTDLVAYIISWGLRIEEMAEPKRIELDDFVKQIKRLRVRSIREIDGNPDFAIWSFAFVNDLRSREEQERE
jgi:hypothetical protein